MKVFPAALLDMTVTRKNCNSKKGMENYNLRIDEFVVPPTAKGPN